MKHYFAAGVMTFSRCQTEVVHLPFALHEEPSSEVLTAIGEQLCKANGLDFIYSQAADD